MQQTNTATPLQFLTVRCTDEHCNAALRIAMLAPIITRANVMYCAVCGHKAMQFIEPDMDLWQQLAHDLALSLNTVKKLHNLWVTIPDSPPNFYTFVKDIREAVSHNNHASL